MIEWKNKCKLREEDHVYLDEDGQEINLPSASRLVEMIHPFPASDIPCEVLQAAIEKGHCVHNRISYFLINNEILECEHNVKTHKNEFNWLRDYLERKILPHTINVYSEISLYNDKFTGTFDLLVETSIPNREIILFDFKTTSKLNKEKEIVQEKLYELLISQSNVKISKFGVINTRNQAVYLFDDHELMKAENNLKQIFEILEQNN